MAEAENIIDIAEKKLLESYSRRHKSLGLPKFDPMILLPILLELGMSLLKNCMQANNDNADSVTKIIKKRPILARAQIRLALRESNLVARQDVSAIIDTLMDVGETATPQQIVEFTAPNSFMV